MGVVVRGAGFVWLLGVVCILLFDHAAKHEHEPRWLWAGASAALWVVCWKTLGGGIPLVLAGQRPVRYVVERLHLVAVGRLQLQGRDCDVAGFRGP